MATKTFVITGCGRSGTTYTSAVLRACGVRCGHENVFNPGTTVPAWGDWEGDCSWLAVPYLDQLKKDEHPIYHQVRDPIEVLRSLTGYGLFDVSRNHAVTPYLKQIYNHDPAIFAPEDELRRAMTWWVRWNLSAEKSSDLTYRVEDLDADLLETLSGRSLDQSCIRKALQTISKQYNRRKRNEKLTWDDVPRDQIGIQLRDLAERYGYKTG